MHVILFAIVIVVGILILIAFTGGSLRGMNKDAANEARHLSQDEIEDVLRPPQKTPKEIEEENQLYGER